MVSLPAFTDTPYYPGHGAQGEEQVHEPDRELPGSYLQSSPAVRVSNDLTSQVFQARANPFQLPHHIEPLMGLKPTTFYLPCRCTFTRASYGLLIMLFSMAISTEYYTFFNLFKKFFS